MNRSRVVKNLALLSLCLVLTACSPGLRNAAEACQLFRQFESLPEPLTVAEPPTYVREVLVFEGYNSTPKGAANCTLLNPKPQNNQEEEGFGLSGAVFYSPMYRCTVETGRFRDHIASLNLQFEEAESLLWQAEASASEAAADSSEYDDLHRNIALLRQESSVHRLNSLEKYTELIGEVERSLFDIRRPEPRVQAREILGDMSPEWTQFNFEVGLICDRLE